MKYYIQCSLIRDNVQTVSWIPEKFAILGKILKLKNNGVWQNGWIVVNTYSKKASADALRDAQVYRTIRTVTDI